MRQGQQPQHLRKRSLPDGGNAIVVPGAPAPKLAAIAAWDGAFNEAIYPIASGKSLFVRIDTPAIIPSADEFERQRQRIETGLNGVARLADWFATHGSRLASTIQPQPPADLGRALETTLREVADRAWKECGYRPTYFLEMLDSRGGIGAAHALLASKPSDGFTKLWELRRLDLSVEAIVIQGQWRSLFTEAELRTAERRLKDAGYIQ